MKPPPPYIQTSRSWTEAEHYQMKEHRCLEKNILTQPSRPTFKLLGITYLMGKYSSNCYFMVLWLGKLSIFEEVLWSQTFPMEIKKKISSWWVTVTERGSTPLKFNSLPPEKLTNPKRKDRFTTINFFKGYVKLQGGTILNQHEPTVPQVNRQHKPTTKTSRTIFVRQQDTWVLRVSSWWKLPVKGSFSRVLLARKGARPFFGAKKNPGVFGS